MAADSWSGFNFDGVPIFLDLFVHYCVPIMGFFLELVLKQVVSLGDGPDCSCFGALGWKLAHLE